MLGSGGWPGWGEGTFSKGFGGCGASLAHPHTLPLTHMPTFLGSCLCSMSFHRSSTFDHSSPSTGCTFPTKGVFLPGFHSTLQEPAVPVGLSRGSHKPQLCENCPHRAHCSPPSTQAHSPSCSGISSKCPPMLGKERGDRCSAFGKLAAPSH